MISNKITLKSFTALIFLVFFSNSYSQNFNWITPNQTYLKMYVADDGIYRIEKTDFSNAGISTTGIDPRTVKVYYKGNQIPIYFSGEQDGIFDDADYFDFWGQRNYGGLTNAYNNDNSIAYTTNEYYNLYSDTSAYWISWNGSYGLRFTNYNNNSTIIYPNDYYYKTIRFEQDSIYFKGITINPDTDFRNFSNDKFQGEGWYMKYMLWNNSVTRNFTASLLSNFPQPVKVKLFAQPETQNTSATNEHRLLFKINTYQSDSLKRDNFNRFDTTITFSSSNLINGLNTSSFRYLYIPTSPAMTLYFDFYEISYPRRFEFENNTLSFNSDITDSTVKLFKVKGYNSANQINIYDVKNGCRVINYSFSNDTLLFFANGNGNFEIINKSINKKPLRIKQKQVPNLVTSSTGADYLIVYNKLFSNPAEQLRQYRETHDGFRSEKAEIEDIYDIFNFGMEDPLAVRRFVKNVFETWQTPKLKFLCLFGRGSLDPKKNLGPSSIYNQNFVPVYGNPITDGYFANFNLNTFNYAHNISVGRLPVYTLQEAQDIVNKIMYYESLSNSPNPNWKNFLMVVVGPNKNQLDQFIYQSNNFINNYISPPPLSAEPHRVYKIDSTGYITFNYKDSVINEFNRGPIVTNYIGHAGNGTWEMSIEDPNTLNNINKCSFVLSMTCFTGKYAESSFRGFGEKFMTAQNKGAIGFIGTTGWSFSSSGNIMNDYLLKSLSIDTLRRIGEIIKKASNTISIDSSNFYSRNTNNCYNLIGDPATTLLIPKYPEFSITNNDYQISNQNPSIKEIVNLKIFPRNNGLNADSCKIRFQLNKNNLNYITHDTIVYNWGSTKSIGYNFKLDTVGLYDMKILLDTDNWYTQEQISDNSISIPINITNSTFTPLKPINNQIIYNDTVKFSGINPNINLSYNNVKLLLEIDTTLNFNSNNKQSFFKNGFTGNISSFNVRINSNDSSIVYFWRMGAIINNDTSNWSSAEMVKLNFTRLSNGDSLIKININNIHQYGHFIENLVSNTNSISLNNFIGNVFARSYGSNSFESSYFRVNNYALYIDQGGALAGLSMWKVKRNTGNIEQFLNLRMNTATSSDSILSFLNTFDSTSFLFGMNASYVASGVGFNTATKIKMRQFGSVYADSIPAFGWFNTWSFIGYLGANSGQVSEQYHPYSSTAGWVQSISQLFPMFTASSGTITQIFGPAQTWQNFNWQQEVFPNSSLYFNVYGVNRNNQDTLLMQNLTTYNNVDLSGINAYQYPYLKLITRLSIDTVLGIQSPIFKGISLNYVGPPEIALDNNSIFKSDSIVNSGDSVSIGGNYYNVGYTPLNAHIRNYYALDGAGNKVPLRSDTIYQQIKVDSSLFFKATFKVKGLPIYKKYNNQIAIVIDVQALNQNDIYYYNNSVISTFYVKGSVVDFNTDVFSDGVKLFGNDYVRSDPELLIKLIGEDISELLSADTTLFRIMINNQFVSLSNYSSSKNSKNLTKSSDRGNLAINLTPHLNEGLNELRLISNKTGASDTAKFILNVTNETSLLDVYNYPNPMRNNTTFSFTLTGNQIPTECRIKIFSAAGRVIKEINVPVVIGFNQVQWNGQDADGDYIANGVYLYKIILKGSEQKATEVKKLVVLK